MFSRVLGERFLCEQSEKNVEGATFIFYYGPYEFSGSIKHRVKRILPLAEKLKNKLGAEVILVPTEILDRLTVHYKGKIVFICNLTHIKFGGECRDYVSMLAYSKCKEAIENEKKLEEEETGKQTVNVIC